MKNGFLQFLIIIAGVAFLLICLRILVYFFGEHYIDAMAVLLIFANVCFMIKNGIKKSDFKKEYIQKMEIKRGGVALIHSFLVFVFWLLYNATMG